MRSALRIFCDSNEVAKLMIHFMMQTPAWNLEIGTWNREPGTVKTIVIAFLKGYTKISGSLSFSMSSYYSQVPARNH